MGTLLTMLETACELEKQHLVDAILADPELDRGMALCLAANWGDEHVLTKLLAMDAPVDALDDHGWTALHRLAGVDLKEIPEYLPYFQAVLDKTPPLEARNSNGDTPLNLAAFWQNTEAVKLLLAKGAAVDVPDKDGNTALLQIADFDDTDEVMTLLLDAGADMNIRNHNGENALAIADANCPEVAELLRARLGLATA